MHTWHSPLAHLLAVIFHTPPPPREGVIEGGGGEGWQITVEMGEK